MRYFYTGFALLLSLTIQAQSDSTRTEYNTEDEKISSAEIKRFIRYITRANVEEKTLIKIGFWPVDLEQSTGYYRSTQVSLNVFASVEQKVSPTISILVGVKNSFGYATNRSPATLSPTTGVVHQNSYGTGVSAIVGGRYYYAMGKRIREGKSANNFSGNYIGAHVRQTLYFYEQARSYDYQSQMYYTRKTTRLNTYYRPAIDLVYGIQRRLGRRGYVDVNAGPQLLIANPSSLGISKQGLNISIQLNAQVGLGW